MPKKLRIVLLVVLVSLCSSAVTAQQLLSQEHWPDGTLRATRYSDGMRVHFITFHENGQVKEVGCFRNGRRDGVWKQFSDTGTLLACAGFRNGERQGVWQFRNTDDSPLGQLTYAAGKLLRGESMDTDGALIAQREY